MPKTHFSKRKRYTDVGAEFIPFLISKTYAICRGGIYSVPNKQNHTQVVRNVINHAPTENKIFFALGNM